VILTRKEKASLVIKLAEAGKTTRHIAQVAHVSLKDIGTILRRYTGEEGESPYREKGLSKCPTSLSQLLSRYPIFSSSVTLFDKILQLLE
jgi:hypothetical protein